VNSQSCRANFTIGAYSLSFGLLPETKKYKQRFPKYLAFQWYNREKILDFTPPRLVSFAKLLLQENK
jgi:hypothetical protein